MTNLVFDLSNMFFRSMFIVGGYGSKGYTFDTQVEVDQLMRKVSTDISYIIRQTNPSRVIITMDSRSWRKDIEIEENEGYKANRKKSDKLNWDNIFSTMEEFGEILEGNGFIVSKVDTAEADDLMTLWRDELLYNQNQHVILVSSDEDVRQLTSSFPYESSKTAYAVVYNPFTSGRGSTRKLFIPNNFTSWLEEEDAGSIFDRSIDMDKEDFVRLRDNEGITFEEVNGDEIALKKIFCGDDGDNVPAIYTWIAKDEAGNPKIDKKTGEPRIVRITNSKYQKIIDSASVSDYKELNGKEELVGQLLEGMSGERPPFSVTNRIKRQVKLVVLAAEVFPKQIVETFTDTVKEKLDRPQIHPQNWNMNSILEGTRYVKSPNKKNAGAESSIFKEVDRIKNKSLF